MSQSEKQENLWIPIYQMYQKDQDQISDATYISDAVLTTNTHALSKYKLQNSAFTCSEAE